MRSTAGGGLIEEPSPPPFRGRERTEPAENHAAELPTFETLLLERKRDILFVWLNRPETRNALGKAMVRDLTAVADLLAADADIRAAVIRGANGTFCSGGDINGFKEMFSTPAPRPARGTVSRPQPPLRRDHVALRGAAADHRDGGRRRGLWRRARPDVRRRRGAGAADAKFSISETTLGVPPAQIAPFVARASASRARGGCR